MRQLEQYVRGSQLPDLKPKRPALLRPSSIPARTASGGLGSSKGEAQTPFENYVPAGGEGGSTGEVTPLPVGDVTLLDHSSGTPIDISQASSVVLRMNSRLHIFPFIVSERNPGGSRVWKCDVFIEPGGVPLDFNLRFENGMLENVLSTLTDGTKVFLSDRLLPSNFVTDIRVFAYTMSGLVYATEGVHYTVLRVSDEDFRVGYPGLSPAGLPELFYGSIHIKPAWDDAFRLPQGNASTPGFEWSKFQIQSERAYAQISPGHGTFHSGGSAAIDYSDAGTLTADNNGNPIRSIRETQTVQFDTRKPSNTTQRRRSWHAKLVYFEKTNEWLCHDGGMRTSI